MENTAIRLDGDIVNEQKNPLFELGLKYPTLLGKLWGNLSSLELTIRIYIARVEGIEEQSPQLEKMKVGEVVNKHPLVWCGINNSFSEVIDYFNRLVTITKRIDKEKVLKLRNTLAHSRIFSLNKQSPFIMMGFVKSDKGIIINYKQIMNQKWFDENIKWTGNEVERISGLYNSKVINRKEDL
ncbi:MAG: hypothetical protein AABX04_00900 [Nanoarchaeota archaeon]